MSGVDSFEYSKRRKELKVTFEDVREIAADIFQVPSKRINLQSSPDTIESWDSLQQLNLILALEQSFGFEFEPEDMERMTSIEKILTILEAKQQKRG